MKKISILILLSAIINVGVVGQRKYSNENLENSSKTELDSLLIKAQKYKKMGLIFTIAGPLSAGAGLLIFIYNFSDSEVATIGAGLFLAGSIVMITGIVHLTAWSIRIKNINKSLEQFLPNAKLNISPQLLYNNQSNTFVPGIGLSVRF